MFVLKNTFNPQILWKKLLKYSPNAAFALLSNKSSCCPVGFSVGLVMVVDPIDCLLRDALRYHFRSCERHVQLIEPPVPARGAAFKAMIPCKCNLYTFMEPEVLSTTHDHQVTRFNFWEGRSGSKASFPCPEPHEQQAKQSLTKYGYQTLCLPELTGSLFYICVSSTHAKKSFHFIFAWCSVLLFINIILKNKIDK